MASLTKKFLAWSYSRWHDYQQCPLKAKLKYLDKITEPENPAMARGSAIHKLAEDYLKGVRRTLPKELKAFGELLRGLKKNKHLKVEESWAFDGKWGLASWFGKECWCRVKMDVASPTLVGQVFKKLQVIDWKTGKLNPEHQEQLGLYALAGLLQFPDVEEVETVLAYVDQPITIGVNPVTKTYTRQDLPALKKEWEKRVGPMMRDTKFAPRPNDKCRWCHYRASNGGPCKF
jgi:hypothetical protein